MGTSSDVADIRYRVGGVPDGDFQRNHVRTGFDLQREEVEQLRVGVVAFTEQRHVPNHPFAVPGGLQVTALRADGLAHRAQVHGHDAESRVDAGSRQADPIHLAEGHARVRRERNGLGCAAFGRENI